MTQLDAYVLIAHLPAGPGAAHVRAMLRNGDCAIAAANLIDVLDVIQRVLGILIERVRAVIDPLLDGNGKTCAISLADAVLIASGQPSDRIASRERSRTRSLHRRDRT